MKVLLCGIAKLENNYIREWVEWYKRIGVDHICLYDNNEPNGEKFEEVISDYIDSGFVEIIDFRGKTCCQKEAYNHCYSRYKDIYDWFLFLDIDELLEIYDYNGQIKSWLSEDRYKLFEGILVFWKSFDDNDLIKVENNNYNLYDRFKHVVNKEDYPFPHQWQKTLVRGGLNIFYKKSVHHPIGDINVCTVTGQAAPNKNRCRIWTNEIASINHYRFKTIEEFITNKLIRLWPDRSAEASRQLLNINTFWELNKRTSEKEEYAQKLLNDYGHIIYNE